MTAASRNVSVKSKKSFRYSGMESLILFFLSMQGLQEGPTGLSITQISRYRDPSLPAESFRSVSDPICSGYKKEQGCQWRYHVATGLEVFFF